MKKDTQIVNAGRQNKWTQGVVNVPVVRASTVVFEDTKAMKHATANRANQTLFYGRRGTQTAFAFCDAIAELEGGAGCALYPSGTAAIANAILSVVQAGDHILMVDTAYEPTRDYCQQVLARLGVETTYYDPLIGADIAQLIRKNTRVIFMESPGSITMEVQDIRTLCQVGHAHDCIMMLDNTWASPVNLQPFELGVDVSIQAATKYIVGHSDVMMGTVTATEKYWPQIRENSYLMGQCTSPDDIYLAARGLRTLAVRMKQHQQNALKVANWLKTRTEVKRLLHPAFAESPGHEFWQRDYLGANGLFSFVLNCGNQQALNAFVDGMHHFKMGYSWGGFESLILAISPESIRRLRTATNWQEPFGLIRLHIGLEDADDLIDDLARGFERFNAELAREE